MGQKNDVDTFSCNSAESKPIWMKSAALRAHCWGLALADFGHERQFEGQQKFVFVLLW